MNIHCNITFPAPPLVAVLSVADLWSSEFYICDFNTKGMIYRRQVWLLAKYCTISFSNCCGGTRWDEDPTRFGFFSRREKWDI